MARQIPRGNPISVRHKISPIIRITSPIPTVISLPVKLKTRPISFHIIVKGSSKISINNPSI